MIKIFALLTDCNVASRHVLALNIIVSYRMRSGDLIATRRLLVIIYNTMMFAQRRRLNIKG